MENDDTKTVPQECGSDNKEDVLSKKEMKQEAEENSVSNKNLCNQNYYGWLSNMYTSSTELWGNVKNDLVEVASAAAKNPSQSLGNTMYSIKDKVSGIVNALDESVSQYQECSSENKEEVNMEVKDEQVKQENTDKDQNSGVNWDPNPLINNISSTIFGLSDMGNKYLKSYFMIPTQDDEDEERLVLPDGCLNTSYSIDNKDVRVQILQADPLTYSTLPSAVEGACSYEDWFEAYFDVSACQPRPGMPLPSGKVLNEAESAQRAHQALAPVYPGPTETLDASPMVRRHLLSLVDPDLGLTRSAKNSDNISEVDFWSRYYYRLWCLDITEARRKRMMEKVSAEDQKEEIGWDDDLEPKVAKPEESAVIEKEVKEEDVHSTHTSESGELLTATSESPIIVSEDDLAAQKDETVIHLTQEEIDEAEVDVQKKFESLSVSSSTSGDTKDKKAGKPKQSKSTKQKKEEDTDDADDAWVNWS